MQLVADCLADLPRTYGDQRRRDQVPGGSPAMAADTTGVAGSSSTAVASRARKAPSSPASTKSSSATIT
jgi:hypothetical protein